MEKEEKKLQTEYSGNYREMFYSYDKDGKYDKEPRLHDDSDKLFINQFWEVAEERIQEARKKVLTGKASPIVFYMEKTLLDPLSLSMQVGISVFRVKMHFKPSVFKRLNDSTRQKYATAFSIPVDQLNQVD